MGSLRYILIPAVDVGEGMHFKGSPFDNRSQKLVTISPTTASFTVKDGEIL